MTLLTFRAPAADVVAADRWAQRLGTDRSAILRDALRRHLATLAAEDDVAAWEKHPLDPSEAELGAAADWGPSEDWSDWSDAAG